MDELLALLERYAPGYRSRVQGASKLHVRYLEQVFGRPLPKFYQEFVRVMGADGGPLLSQVETYQPDKISKLYRFASDEMPPRRFLFVFGDPSSDDEHYWLDLEAPSEEGDCQVVRMPFGGDEWETHLSRHFVSLREMLFVWAMENVRRPELPLHAGYLVRSEYEAPEKVPDAEDLARAFEKLGFTRLPYPRHFLLYERADAAIELGRSPDEPGFWFSISAREQQDFNRFCAIVEDIKGVEKA